MNERPAESIVAGTRRSRLALWQTDYVLGLLRKRWPELHFERREYSTHGDDSPDRSLAEIGGRGAFTEAIERALLDGAIDFAVHSLKDLPVKQAADLVIAAVVGPRDAGEALVSRSGVSLAGLPRGAVVGTSSLRRRAQLLFRRPDLQVRDIRGNVETRVAKVERGDYDAAVLASAGIARLGLEGSIAELLSAKVILPAAGQGAIAVQCRRDDERLRRILAAVDDADLEECTRAERAFLEVLGAGCSAPVAALAVKTAGAKEKSIRMVGRVIATDGSRMIEVEDGGDDPDELGRRLAEEALRRGTGEILTAAGEAAPAGSRRSLEGKRVIVTRPRAQSEPLAGLLEEKGAQVVLLPVIETRALYEPGQYPEAFSRLSQYRWIVLSSSNAAAYFLSAYFDLGGTTEALGERIAVVGSQTAAATTAAGVVPAFIGSGHTGADLARELPVDEGTEVLLPCAERHTEELPSLLEERGARVTVVPIYRTDHLPIGPEAIEELRRGADFVLFTSGSTVSGLIEGVRSAAGAELLGSLFSQAKIACIGPSTAAAVRQFGFEPTIVAARHTAEGLVIAVSDAEGESVP